MRRLVLAGALLCVAMPAAAETTAYGYDVFGRLIGAGRFQGPADGFSDDIYIDNDGNRSDFIVRNVKQSLNPDGAIVSPDGRTRLLFQYDGNFVVYFNGTALWASNTAGSGASRAIMQADGNLVLYDAAMKPVWASNTYGSYGARLAVQNDGNVVIYDVGRRPIWATGTGGHG